MSRTPLSPSPRKAPLPLLFSPLQEPSGKALSLLPAAGQGVPAPPSFAAVPTTVSALSHLNPPPLSCGFTVIGLKGLNLIPPSLSLVIFACIRRNYEPEEAVVEGKGWEHGAGAGRAAVLAPPFRGCSLVVLLTLALFNLHFNLGTPSFGQYFWWLLLQS